MDRRRSHRGNSAHSRVVGKNSLEHAREKDCGYQMSPDGLARNHFNKDSKLFIHSSPFRARTVGTRNESGQSPHERWRGIAHEINACWGGTERSAAGSKRVASEVRVQPDHEARAVFISVRKTNKSRPTRSRRSNMLPGTFGGSWSSGCCFAACRNCIYGSSQEHVEVSSGS